MRGLTPRPETVWVEWGHQQRPCVPAGELPFPGGGGECFQLRVRILLLGWGHGAGQGVGQVSGGALGGPGKCQGLG